MSKKLQALLIFSLCILSINSHTPQYIRQNYNNTSVINSYLQSATKEVKDTTINSGLKFNFNVEYAKLLQNLDVSKYVKGLSVVSDYEIKKDGMLGYDINVQNVIIDDIRLPETVEVDNKPCIKSNCNGSTAVTLKNMQINLIANFTIKVPIVSKETATNAPIKVTVDKIYGQYHFDNGNVHFNNLKVDIGTIDIKFDSTLFNIVYKVFKGLIVSQINKSIPKAQADIEALLNKFTNDVNIIKVPVVDLYFNYTNIDKPTLIFKDGIKKQDHIVNDENKHKGKHHFTKKNRHLYELSDVENTDELAKSLSELDYDSMYNIFSNIMKEVVELKEDDILTKEEAYNEVKSSIEGPDIIIEPITEAVFNPQNEFLKARKPNKNEDTTTAAFLNFGISGYSYTDATHVPTYPAATDMKFIDSNFQKGVSILISDFTMNSLIYIGQQSGQLRLALDQYSKNLPFKIDTKGLQVIFPELAGKYPDDAKKCILTFEVGTLNPIQPTIGTSIENIHLSANFYLKLEVEESDDPFDDPVVAVETTNTFSADISIDIKNDLISLDIEEAIVESVEVTSTIFEKFDSERMRTQLNNVIYAGLDTLKTKLQNIDLNSYIEEYTPFSINSIGFDMNDGYNTVSFNVQQKATKK